MPRRIVGIAMLFIGFSGLALAVFGVLLSRQAIENISSGIENALQLTSESLITVNETLLLTKSTLSQVEEALDTVGITALAVSSTLHDTEPLLEQITQVAARDVPDSLEALQVGLPDVAEAAGAIDDTLALLSTFQFERSVFGIPLSFDLGVDYDPSTPLDATVLELGQGLEGVPDNLRALENDLSTANENLTTIGDNVETIAIDLERINQSLAEFSPLVDDYIGLVAATNDLINQTRTDLTKQLETAELIATILFIWIGVSQIVPLYLGWELLVGNKRESMIVKGS